MRFAITSCLILGLGFSCAVAQSNGNDDYFKLGPDSLRQEGVPHGEVKGPFTLPSEAYEGTQHTYWVYVPAQYDPEKACSLMIFNDGHAFLAEEGSARATNVIDNLVFRREIPAMIAVFINPGRRPDQPEATSSEWGDRTTNRPTEYNSLDDKYARVIVDELLPQLYSQYNLSKDAKDHGIGGCSSARLLPSPSPGKDRIISARSSAPSVASRTFAVDTTIPISSARAKRSQFASSFRTVVTTIEVNAEAVDMTKPGIGFCKTFAWSMR